MPSMDCAILITCYLLTSVGRRCMLSDRFSQAEEVELREGAVNPSLLVDEWRAFYEPCVCLRVLCEKRS